MNNGLPEVKRTGISLYGQLYQYIPTHGM